MPGKETVAHAVSAPVPKPIANPGASVSLGTVAAFAASLGVAVAFGIQFLKPAKPSPAEVVAEPVQDPPVAAANGAVVDDATEPSSLPPSSSLPPPQAVEENGDRATPAQELLDVVRKVPTLVWEVAVGRPKA